MGAISPEGTHICVRCGHANAGDVSFCVECGFNLHSALQRDYDSYREVSRGDSTMSEATALPESITATLQGIPPAPGGTTEVLLGSDPIDVAGAEDSGDSTLPDFDPPAQMPARTAGAPAESIERHADPFEEDRLAREEDRLAQEEEARRLRDEVIVEPLPMESLEDEAVAPSRPPSLEAPASRPVHENLKEGVTTYVHASRRGFRRMGAEDPEPWFKRSLVVGVGVGLLILGVVLVLTR